MRIGEDQRRLLTLCALRLGDETLDWPLLAREAMRNGGVEHLLDGSTTERSPEATRAKAILRRRPSLAQAEARVESELDAASGVGARLTTVLDADYPVNLRLVANLPPFLFLRGSGPGPEDVRSVAVVGTRTASARGHEAAEAMTAALVREGVVIVSGLARGIDTVAHTTTLAHGGRTVAVLGTGITRCYPPENRELAERIAAEGLLVSQFWPTATPTRWSFPFRNVVMSGMAQGTVVIEASSTSGAKLQARLAHEHAKLVFLLRDLVDSEDWARRYVERGMATVVDSAADVIPRLASPDRVRQVAMERQLTFDLA